MQSAKYVQRRTRTKRCSRLQVLGFLAFGTFLHQTFVPSVMPRRPHFLVPIAVSVTPLPAMADMEDMPGVDPGLVLSVLAVLGAAAGGLSWVASLKPRETNEGQPRSTSLYRVFQAKMRAGEFAELAPKPDGKDQEDASSNGDGDEELDAFVDAYVDGLEDDIDAEGDFLGQEGRGPDSGKPGSMDDRKKA